MAEPTVVSISPVPQYVKSDPLCPHVGYGKLIFFIQEKMPNGFSSGSTAKTMQVDLSICGEDKESCIRKISEFMQEAKQREMKL